MGGSGRQSPEPAGPEAEPPVRRGRWRPGGLPAAGIIALAAVLRFVALGQKSLWLDEIMSVRLAQMPSVADTVRAVAAYDVHPPLYPILHHLWMRLGGGDAFARIPSAVFGVAAVGLVYLLARRLLGERPALAAAALLAVSPYHIYYSQEARHYALVVLLTLGLNAAFLPLLEGPRAPARAWAAYALVGAACLNTFLMTLLVVVVHAALYLLHVPLRRRNAAAGSAALAAMGLSLVPWLPVLRRGMARMDWIARTQGVAGRPTAVEWLGAVREWMLAPAFVLGREPTRDITLGAVALAVMALGLWRMAGPVAASARADAGNQPRPVLRAPRRERSPLGLVAGLLVGPVVLYLLLPMQRVHRFDPKHLVFLQPICLLAVAGLATPAARGGRTGRFGSLGLLLVAVVGVVNAAVLWPYYDRARQKSGWERAAAFIEAEQTRLKRDGADFVLVRPYAGAPQAFRYYYRGPLRVRTGGDPRAPLPRFRRIWLVTCWNEALRPQPKVITWIRRHLRRVDARGFFGFPRRAVWCELYETTPATPPSPAFDEALHVPEMDVRRKEPTR